MIDNDMRIPTTLVFAARDREEFTILDERLLSEARRSGSRRPAAHLLSLMLQLCWKEEVLPVVPASACSMLTSWIKPPLLC
jgi:hypothetical protein